MRNIVLIGMSGVGKTSIGLELSKKLNYSFIDLDIEIEEKYKKKIEDIFKYEGEESFREKESSVLNNLLITNNTVISTGGGIVERENNIKKINNIGWVIFLDGSIETLEKNIKSDKKNLRPLLLKGELFKNLESMHKKRYKKYETISDLTINVNNKSIDEIVENILKVIDENHSCSYQ